MPQDPSASPRPTFVRTAIVVGAAVVAALGGGIAIAANAPAPRQVVSAPAPTALGARTDHARARARHPRRRRWTRSASPPPSQDRRQRVHRRRRGRCWRHSGRTPPGVAVNITIDEDATAQELPHRVAAGARLGRTRRPTTPSPVWSSGQLGHLPARHRRPAERLQPARLGERHHRRDRLLRRLWPRPSPRHRPRRRPGATTTTTHDHGRRRPRRPRPPLGGRTRRGSAAPVTGAARRHRPRPADDDHDEHARA